MSDDQVSQVSLGWSDAFHTTKPIIFGYIPMSMAFGLLFEQAGAPWYLCFLMSLCVFAGASQFVATSLITAGAGLLQIAIATLVVNLRHIFYGLSLLNNVSKRFNLKKAYTILCLTDEVYSVLSAKRDVADEEFSFRCAFLCHIYWVTGTLLGALVGHIIKHDLSFLGFSLTALFVVLAMEQWYVVQRKLPFILGTIACVFSYIVWREEMLILSIALTAIGLYISYHREQRHER